MPTILVIACSCVVFTHVTSPAFQEFQRFQKAAGDSVDQGKAASRVESTQDHLLLDTGLATCSEMSPQPVRWVVSLHPAPRESKVLTH